MSTVYKKREVKIVKPKKLDIDIPKVPKKIKKIEPTEPDFLRDKKKLFGIP